MGSCGTTEPFEASTKDGHSESLLLEREVASLIIQTGQVGWPHPTHAERAVGWIDVGPSCGQAIHYFTDRKGEENV